MSPTPTGDAPERLDFSFVLLTQLGRVLAIQSPVSQYNRLLELAALLHPYQDGEYRGFAKEYFAKTAQTRIDTNPAWLTALMDLAARAGFLGMKDVREG
jgi:hypothetical protein